MTHSENYNLLPVQTKGVDKKMSPDTRVDGITNEFRQRINDGEFGTAGRIPSLRMLANQFDTTHETMNKVVQRLQSEGILFSLGRAGIFVNIDEKRKRVQGLTSRFDEAIRQQGLEPTEVDIEDPSLVNATNEVAHALQVPPGTSVVRRFRKQGEHRKGISDVLYRTAENFYSPKFVGDEILRDIQSDVHLDVLEAIRQRFQKEVRQVHDDIIARFPRSHELEQLNIVRNTPVVDIWRTSYSEDEDGEVIMFSKTVSVAHYFIFSYDYKPYWLTK